MSEPTIMPPTPKGRAATEFDKLVASIRHAIQEAESHMGATMMLEAIRQAIRHESERLDREGQYVRAGIFRRHWMLFTNRR